MHGGRRKAASSIFKPPPQLSAWAALLFVWRESARDTTKHSCHFPEEKAGFWFLVLPSLVLSILVLSILVLSILILSNVILSSMVLSNAVSDARASVAR
jgi:hypothetical protein